MKKIALILSLFITSILMSQESVKPMIINAEGVYGLGGIYDDELESGGVGFGLGTWLPFKDGLLI